MPFPAALPRPLRLLALCLLTFAVAHAATPSNPLPLWTEGAPGSEARRQEPEKVAGSNVSNIHHPSLTPYWPETPAPGGPAVIIAPGGGHARLAAQHEGHHVAQSNVILHYLADAYDQFLGRSAAEEIRVEEWLQWDQDRMSSLAMLRSMKKFPRYKQPDEVVAFVSGRAVQALDFLDHHLGTSKFVAGPRPTVADIAIFATVALADEAEVEIARWPNVRAWAERFMKLPGAKHPYAAMPREDRIGG